jgi:hypothetical protein
MALDMKKIQSSLKDMKSQGGGGNKNNDLVKLPLGDHLIRIIPYKLDMDMPFIETYTHYGIANQNFLCPKKMSGEDCPICDLGWEMWQEFERTQDVAVKECFKNIMPKLRVFVPAIVKESTDPAIVWNKETNPDAKWWGMAKGTYEEILDEIISLDSEDIDVLDVKAGIDIHVEMENFMGRKDRFAVKKIKVARKQTPMIEGGVKKDIDAVINSIKDITELSLGKQKSLSEINEALAKHANPSAESDTNTDSDEGTSRDFGKKDDDEDLSLGDSGDGTKEAIDKKFAGLK